MPLEDYIRFAEDSRVTEPYSKYDQVDVRVRKWMALATPVSHSDQVAALVGVTERAAHRIVSELAEA